MSRSYKKPYTKSKRFDASCRCNGGCPWCEGNRMVRVKKEVSRTSFKLAEEEQIDSSTDAMDFYYPEKNAYLDKHYYVDEQETTEED